MGFSTIPFKAPMKYCLLKLQWTDAKGDHEKQFEDVYQLAEFLNEHPELAEYVKFKTKKKTE